MSSAKAEWEKVLHLPLKVKELRMKIFTSGGVFRTLKRAITAPLVLILGNTDVGWAGSFQPMIVSDVTLAELRNLAGPPPTPGMKMFEVNLESGQAKWKVWKTPSYGRRRRR